MARVVVAYAFYLGEYRDGTKVERDIEKAYAWTSLANYQGNPEAQNLLNRIIPELDDRESADHLAGEYFKLYGAVRNSSKHKPEGPNPESLDDAKPSS